jgi:hypothetical protein
LFHPSQPGALFPFLYYCRLLPGSLPVVPVLPSSAFAACTPLPDVVGPGCVQFELTKSVVASAIITIRALLFFFLFSRRRLLCDSSAGWGHTNCGRVHTADGAGATKSPLWPPGSVNNTTQQQQQDKNRYPYPVSPARVLPVSLAAGVCFWLSCRSMLRRQCKKQPTHFGAHMLAPGTTPHPDARHLLRPRPTR